MDYSQGGQKSPETEINTQWVQLFQTLENRVEDNLSLISFGALHEWVRAALQLWDSETNKQASPSSSLCSTLHRHRKETFI